MKSKSDSPNKVYKNMDKPEFLIYAAHIIELINQIKTTKPKVRIPRPYKPKNVKSYHKPQEYL